MANPDAPAAPAAPVPRASWALWLGRDAVTTLLLFFAYFYIFTLLSHGLIAPQRLWPGAWAVVGGCQFFFLLGFLTERRLPWLWPAAKATAAALFVAWHLFFFLFRNPLDLWDKPVEDWCKTQAWWKEAEPYYDDTDRVTRRYGNFFGIEQGWKMFPPPLARAGWFLDSEITFSDGGVETFPSDNEPDLARYVRLGGWRLRKVEAALVWATPEELHAGRADNMTLFAPYVRWRVRRWRETHPDDPREPATVKLVRRRFDLPEPGGDPTKHEGPVVTEIGVFDADGRLR